MQKKLKQYIGTLSNKELGPIMLAASVVCLVGFFAVYYREDLFLSQMIFSILFFFLFLIPGYAILSIKYFKDFDKIERFVLSFGVSFLVYALVVILTNFFSGQALHIVNTIILLIMNLGGLFYIFRKNNIRKEEGSAGRKLLWVSIVFILFIVFLQILVILPFSMPKTLQDGPYVFKNKNNLHIKIQALTGDLPADNYIPYVFSQFLIRDISFKENRPMLPGQEVSSRTVLMGLNSAFFLSVFNMPEVSVGNKIDTFKYVGINWPNVGKFGNENQSFAIFLTMGMIMNASFLLAIFLLIAKIFGYNKGMGIMMILMIFPFVINQTIFTWPKLLMAYYLIIGLYLVLKKNSPYITGLFLALSFHSHPSAIIYIGFIVMYWISRKLFPFNKNFLIDFWKMISTLILMILPWIIWIKFIVNIPSNLLSQNVTTNDYKLISLIKVRLSNLYLLFIPGQMQAISFADKLFKEMIFTFAGAIGIYFLIAYLYVIIYLKKYYREILMLALGPIILLTMPWGKIFGSFSILFAQPVIPLYFAFAVMFFLKFKKTTMLLLVTQVVVSIYALWFGMYNITLQIQKSDVQGMLFIVAVSMQITVAVTGIILIFRKKESNKFL